ncbi:MAG: AEC family transporter [Clostridia bacterium]|nr:AEC family transporter [Clostridia bacterium]
MLSNLTYSVNAILPIFLLAVLGALFRKTGKIDDRFVDTADWLMFKIALPVMLFQEVAGSSLSDSLDLKLILFLIVSVTLSFLLTSVVVSVTVRDRSKRGALIQGCCRSNFAILGVPIAVNMFGDIGGQTIAIAMPFVILMFNTYSVIILTVYSGDSDKRLDRGTVIGILKNIATNPLIIGILLGVVFLLAKIPIPAAADKTLTYLANLTTPLALISLGANFRMESLKGRVGYALIGALTKTVILPAAAVTAAALIGLRGPSLGVVLICFGAPTAVSSYIMAKKMGNDHELAAQILLLSTLFCVLTIFVGIFILRTLALI